MAHCFRYEIEKEGQDTVLRIDAENCPFFPSIEDSELCMGFVMDRLIEEQAITRVVFNQKRDYEYDYLQVQLLSDIALLYKKLAAQRNLFDFRAMGLDRPHARIAGQRFSDIRDIIYTRLKTDPVGAYLQAARILRLEKIGLERAPDEQTVQSHQKYIALLESFTGMMEKTKLMLLAKPHLAGYKLGDRGIYHLLFNPTTRPDFMFTRLMAQYPTEGEEIDNYSVDDTEVTIFRMPDSTRPLYHIIPPEFRLDEDKYELLDVAKRVIAEHKPKRSEFVDPERMRQVFSSIGTDLLSDLASTMNIKLRQSEVDKLTDILVRYTIGFGLIEVLLKDPKIQDITINSPMGRAPMFIVHQDYDECVTNIVPTAPEGESWATKLRFMSGRPLDEANPVLDTELLVPGARARVAVVAPPLNTSELAFAFRRHRDDPWTLPLFIDNKMISPLAAGVLSFLIDGARTFLVAGTRSAGKSSLLGSFMTEIMRKHRIITIEDTLELPVDALKKLEYNVQSMKVAAAMTEGTSEVSAAEGIRTTLRMGDSALIVGEVRSTEARALYEAMRIGALANVVAGTIHGDSPYGVYDRIVNDLDVPKTSFKATDIIVVANPVRSADGLSRERRVTQITEVGKYWESDPLAENGFRDLLTYNAETDLLEPSTDLMNGESDVIKAVARNVKEWASSWEAVWDNIQMRTDIKTAIVDTAHKTGRRELLEAEFVVQANDEFHRISERIKEETGAFERKRIVREWNTWLRGALKRKELNETANKQ